MYVDLLANLPEMTTIIYSSTRGTYDMEDDMILETDDDNFNVYYFAIYCVEDLLKWGRVVRDNLKF